MTWDLWVVRADGSAECLMSNLPDWQRATAMVDTRNREAMRQRETYKRRYSLTPHQWDGEAK